jgi:hypothetical protein
MDTEEQPTKIIRLAAVGLEQILKVLQLHLGKPMP